MLYILYCVLGWSLWNSNERNQSLSVTKVIQGIICGVSLGVYTIGGVPQGGTTLLQIVQTDELMALKNATSRGRAVYFFATLMTTLKTSNIA